MTAKKISVSFEADLADVIRETAAIEGMSVSAWLADAAADRVRNRILGLALEAAVSEDGQMSNEEMLRLIETARQSTIMVTGSQSTAA